MLRQAPVLVTLPPALASPAGPGSIGPHPDTPALLHVSLPGGGPLGGELMMQTALLSPTGQLQQLNSLVGPPGAGAGSGGGAGGSAGGAGPGAGAYRPGPLSSGGRGGVLKVRGRGGGGKGWCWMGMEGLETELDVGRRGRKASLCNTGRESEPTERRVICPLGLRPFV